MNSAGAVLDSKGRSLIQEAAEWRLIGLLFECPGAGWRERVAALASEAVDPELRAAAQAAQAEAAEGVYHSIFGPGGPAPAREVSYHDSIQLGYLMSELAGYYNAFAYQPATPEPSDHISVEAGFVAYLRLKEAYARACSDAEHAGVTAEAAERFLGDHLAVMTQPLAAALDATGVRYLSLAGRALLRRVGPPKTGGQAPRGDALNVLDDSLFGCGES